MELSGDKSGDFPAFFAVQADGPDERCDNEEGDEKAAHMRPGTVPADGPVEQQISAHHERDQGRPEVGVPEETSHFEAGLEM